MLESSPVNDKKINLYVRKPAFNNKKINFDVEKLTIFNNKKRTLMSESLPLTIRRSNSMLESLRIVTDYLPFSRSMFELKDDTFKALRYRRTSLTEQLFWGRIISIGDRKRNRRDLEVSSYRCSANAPSSFLSAVFSYGGRTWDTLTSMPVPIAGSSNPRVFTAKSLEGLAVELTKAVGAA